MDNNIRARELKHEHSPDMHHNKSSLPLSQGGTASTGRSSMPTESGA